MKILLLFLFFIIRLSPLSAFFLKNSLHQANEGDFMLLEFGKTVTLLRVAQKNDHQLFLESLSIPSDRFYRLKTPTREWYSSGSPGKSSHTLAIVDIDRGALENAYSYTRAQWLNTNESDLFLRTLFHIDFQEVEASHRRRTGPRNPSDPSDLRPLWQPPLKIDGRLIDASFKAYRGNWPNDGSELSGLCLEIYLPESASMRVPSFFPYFIEIDGKMSLGKMRAIDSGIQLFGTPFTPPSE